MGDEVTFLSAAKSVLRAARRPLTAREILERATAAGLLPHSQGKTPRETLSAALYVDAKDPDTIFEKLAEPGIARAKRGTVRWRLRYR